VVGSVATELLPREAFYCSGPARKKTTEVNDDAIFAQLEAFSVESSGQFQSWVRKKQQ